MKGCTTTGVFLPAAFLQFISREEGQNWFGLTEERKQLQVWC